MEISLFQFIYLRASPGDDPHGRRAPLRWARAFDFDRF